jgi:hypothetical protein
VPWPARLPLRDVSKDLSKKFIAASRKIIGPYLTGWHAEHDKPSEPKRPRQSRPTEPDRLIRASEHRRGRAPSQIRSPGPVGRALASEAPVNQGASARWASGGTSD